MLASLLTAACATRVYAVDPIDLLSDRTRAFVVVNDLPAAWQDHQARISSEIEQGEQSWFLDRFGITVADARDCGVRKVLRAELLVAIDDQGSLGSSEVVLLVLEDGGDLPRIAQQRLRDLNGSAKRRDLNAGISGDVIFWTDANELVQTRVFAQADDVMIVADTEPAARQIIECATQTSSNLLGRQARFQEVRSQLSTRATSDGIAIDWYVNPWLAERDLETRDPQAYATNETVLFAQRHGLMNISAAAGFVQSTGDGESSESYVLLERPFAGTMRMAEQFEGADQWEIPAWFSSQTPAVTLVNADVAAAMRHVSDLFDDAFAEGISGTYEELLLDLKDGLGIDLDADLYAFLGPRAAIISGVDGGQQTRPMAIGFELRDEARVSRAIRVLMQDDPEAKAISLPDDAGLLWVVEGFDDQPDFVLGVAGELAVYANDLNLVRSLAGRQSTLDSIDRDAFERTIDGIIKQTGSDETVRPFMLSLAVGLDDRQSNPLQDGSPWSLFFESSDRLYEILSAEQDEASPLSRFQWPDQQGNYTVIGFIAADGWKFLGRRVETDQDN